MTTVTERQRFRMAETDTISREIIEAERAEASARTIRLRALRLERDAAEEKAQTKKKIR